MVQKACRTIIYSTASLSFLIFPLFKQGCAGEPTLSSSSPHCQGTISATNTLLPPGSPSISRQGSGWNRVRGWSAEGGAVKVGRKKANIYSEARCAEQGQLQRHSPLQQLCNYIQSLHSTESPTTCMQNLHAEPGGSRAAGRKSIMILIAVPRW